MEQQEIRKELAHEGAGKAYVPPAVVFESRLEAQAGSPLGGLLDSLEQVELPQ